MKQSVHSTEKRTNSSFKIAIVIATYNKDISEGLLQGCIKALKEHGLSASTIINITGAFELPLVALKASQTNDAVICLGSVIKGETAHFDYVAGECARGIQDVMLQTQKPIIFGVLTTYTQAEAKERCLDNTYNKGYEAGHTAIEMCHTCTKLSH